MTIDQYPDDDLGVDPSLLGVTHPPQVVLMLGLEIERGDVVQAQRQPVTLLVVPGGPGLGQLLWA